MLVAIALSLPRATTKGAPPIASALSLTVSAIAGAVAVAMRQTNVVWAVACVAGVSATRELGWRLEVAGLADAGAPATWPLP